MRHFRKICGYGALLLWLSTSAACMKSTYSTIPMVSGQTVRMKEAEKKTKTHFFLFGLVASPTVDVSKMCPGGIEWAQVKGNVGDMVLNAITLGIYAPRTVGVKCAAAVGAVQ